MTHILRYAFSTVEDGNMSFTWGDAETVVANRVAFLKKHGLKAQDVVASAIKGDVQPKLVTSVHAGTSALQSNQAIPGHALFTTKSDLGLMLLTADCIPAIISDKTTPAVAVLHLSAQTIDNGLVRNTISTMLNHTKSKASNLQVILGPHIGVKSYTHQIPPVLAHDAWTTTVKPVSTSKVSVNLTETVKIQLNELGILSSKIITHPSDTYSDLTYFSHYRSHKNNEAEGRFATLAWLEDT